MANLVIVESPTKSKTIGRFLGKNYTVKASMGHLRDLPKSQFGVDVDHDFEPKYINIRGKGDLIKELKTLAKKADKIYLATDPDREGEAIAWHLGYLLGVDPESNCRISFHEITPHAVKEAIKHPAAIDMDKVDAQQTRRILDRIVGYKLSPLLWRKIAKGLSAGRVQSVAVKIICDRQKEIDAFEPQEYWTSSVTLTADKPSHKFTAEVTKKEGKKLVIHNEEEARTVTKELLNQSYALPLKKGLLSASLPICVRTLSIWPVLPLRKFAIISARFMAMPTCRKSQTYTAAVRMPRRPMKPSVRPRSCVPPMRLRPILNGISCGFTA